MSQNETTLDLEPGLRPPSTDAPPEPPAVIELIAHHATPVEDVAHALGSDLKRGLGAQKAAETEVSGRML